MSDFPDIIKKLDTFDGNFPAYKLNADNCDVLFSTLPANTDIPPHTHETDNHSIIIEGELNLILEGKEIKYKAGDWCFVPAKTVHSATTHVQTRLIEFWFKN